MATVLYLADFVGLSKLNNGTSFIVKILLSKEKVPFSKMLFCNKPSLGTQFEVAPSPIAALVSVYVL